MKIASRLTLLSSALAFLTLVHVGEVAAQPFRGPGFFPRPVPLPGTGTPNTPPDQQMREQFRRRLFLMMLRARQQTPVVVVNSPPSYSSSMAYPYYPPPRNPMPIALPNNVPAAPAIEGAEFLAGLIDAKGDMAWPLGLQILRPALETKEQRQRIQDLTRTAAQQAARGKAEKDPVEEVGQIAAKLRRQLEYQRIEMAEATYDDAVAFLGRLEASLQKMR